MVEPLDFAHHAGLAPSPGLPEHLDLPDVGPVTAPGGEEHGAVVDVEHLLPLPPALDGLEEELLGLPLPARPLVTLPGPVPEVPPLLRSPAGERTAALERRELAGASHFNSQQTKTSTLNYRLLFAPTTQTCFDFIISKLSNPSSLVFTVSIKLKNLSTHLPPR